VRCSLRPFPLRRVTCLWTIGCTALSSLSLVLFLIDNTQDIIFLTLAQPTHPNSFFLSPLSHQAIFYFIFSLLITFFNFFKKKPLYFRYYIFSYLKIKIIKTQSLILNKVNNKFKSFQYMLSIFYNLFFSFNFVF